MLAELDRAARAFNAMRAGLIWFETYVPRSLVKRLLRMGGTGLVPVERELTVLFTDVIGFSQIAQRLRPPRLATFLNRHFQILAGEIEITEAFELGSAPLHEFMRANVREQDLTLFFDLTDAPVPEEPEAIPLQLLIPAFMISELRRAFEIGFLLFLPFVVIDMVVASVLMSMGMMMLPPVVISLPFKLIFFVLVDGWYLVAGSLVRSFVSG